MARTPKPKRQPTWLEVAVHHGGFRKGAKALLWANSWIFVREALGRDPSVDEVAEWWNESRRTAFREQAAFRECFPMLDTPEALYADPERRAKIAEAAQALNELDAVIRNKRRPNDSDLLETGLLGPAT